MCCLRCCWRSDLPVTRFLWSFSLVEPLPTIGRLFAQVDFRREVRPIAFVAGAFLVPNRQWSKISL